MTRGKDPLLLIAVDSRHRPRARPESGAPVEPGGKRHDSYHDLFYFVLAILLAPLFYAFVKEGVAYLAAVFTLDATKWFLLGGGLGSWGHRFRCWAPTASSISLLHELEHAVVAFFFTFRLPRLEVINTERDPGCGVPGRLYCSPGGRLFPVVHRPLSC